jgi:hypothetical protein
LLTRSSLYLCPSPQGIETGGEVVTNADGILGLAYPPLSTFGKEYPPLFDQLMKEKQLSANKFGFALSASAHGSSLCLGGYDKSKYTGPITYHPVKRKAFWELDGTINGQHFDSIVDTGTSTILGVSCMSIVHGRHVVFQSFTSSDTLHPRLQPTRQVTSFLKKLKGVEIVTHQDEALTLGFYECDKTPKVTLKYGKATVVLTPEATQWGKTDDNRCVLSVMGTEIGQDAWVRSDSPRRCDDHRHHTCRVSLETDRPSYSRLLRQQITGDPLFLSSYVAFNRDKDAVGFAARK